MPEPGHWLPEIDALPVDTSLLQNVFAHAVLALVAVFFDLAWGTLTTAASPLEAELAAAVSLERGVPHHAGRRYAIVRVAHSNHPARAVLQHEAWSPGRFCPGKSPVSGCGGAVIGGGVVVVVVEVVAGCCCVMVQMVWRWYVHGMCRVEYSAHV